MIPDPYLQQINNVINECKEAKITAFQNVQDEIHVLEQVLGLEEKQSIQEDENIKTIYSDHIFHIYNELGVAVKSTDYLDIAEGYYRQINLDIVGNQSRYETTFRHGRNIFYQYKIRKSKSENQNLTFRRYENLKLFVFPAHGILQNLFKEAILDNNLNSRIIRTYIIQELVTISIELARWTEFQYYLDFIPNHERESQFYLLNVVAIDALINNTHCDVFPSVASNIVQNCLLALQDPDIVPINHQKTLNILRQYISSFGTLTGTNGISNQVQTNVNNAHVNQNFQNFNPYRKWTLDNYLGINEHSIYCKCVRCKKDNLKLLTNNSHTRKKWLNKFQPLIDQLKLDFDIARLNYFNSLPSIKIKHSFTVESKIKNDFFQRNVKSRLLISSFKQAFSLLDRIAVSILSIYPDLNDNNYYFHDFMDYVRSNVNMENKTYLIALESLAFELYHQNPTASFGEFKIWRDAMEHNYFFILKNDVTKSTANTKFEHLRRVSYEEEETFRLKTIQILQICRSAIFSLVFLMRDECCQKFFNH